MLRRLFRSSRIGVDFFQDAPAYFEWTYLAFKLCLTKRIIFTDLPGHVMHDTDSSASKSDNYRLAEASVIQHILRLTLPDDIRSDPARKTWRSTCTKFPITIECARQYGAAWHFHLKSLLQRGGTRYLPYTRKLLPYGPARPRRDTRRTPDGLFLGHRGGMPAARRDRMHRLHYAEWGAGEWLAALGAVARARAHSGPNLDIVRCRLGGIVGDRPIHLVNAGRNAIRLALDVFQKAQPQRDRVVVPGYICPSVVDAVLACGLVPVGADVGADLNVTPDSVLEAIDDRTLAVICPHMYGSPAPIAAVERICRDAGVFLIDDSAQVLGVDARRTALGHFR